MKTIGLILILFISMHSPLIATTANKWEESLLEEPIVALGEKRQLPFELNVSANDYVSFAIYYWENPNGKDSPYIVIDGKKNPTLNLLTDAPKKERFFKMVKKLLHAYKRTSDVRFAKRAGDWIRAWWITPQTKMNPHLIYAQIRPGHEKQGIGGGIIDFHDMMYFLQDIEQLKKSPALSKEEWEKVDDYLTLYTKWLETSSQGKNVQRRINNHKIFYLAQCAALAEFLGKDEKALKIVKLAFDQMDAFIDPSGAQPHEMKRATGFSYSVFTLRAWFELAAISKRLKGPDYIQFISPKGTSLKKAIEFLETTANTANQTILKDPINLNTLTPFKKQMTTNTQSKQ